jgi:MFS family permease
MALLSQTSRPRRPDSFDVFAERYFRWFFTSVALADLGMHLRMVVLAWLVLELTDSPAWVGMVIGIRAVPSVILSLWGGALADRVPKKRVVVASRLLFGLLAFLVGLLASSGQLEAWHLLIISVAVGFIFALSRPAGPAWIPMLVPRQRLISANSLLGIASNTGEIVGPGLAGWLIGTWGTDSAFFVIAAIFLMSMLPLCPIEEDGAPPPKPKRSILLDIVDGVRYTKSSHVIMGILLLNSTALFAASIDVMIPVYARDVLRVRPGGFGIMGASLGAGFLIGSITMSFVGNLPRKGLMIWMGAIMWDFSRASFTFSPWFSLSVFLLLVMGAGGSIYFISLMTLLQEVTSDEMRGRVMSIFHISNDMIPLGAMLAGFLAATVNNWFPQLFGAMAAETITLPIFLLIPKFRRA